MLPLVTIFGLWLGKWWEEDRQDRGQGQDTGQEQVPGPKDTSKYLKPRLASLCRYLTSKTLSSEHKARVDALVDLLNNLSC